MKLFKIELKRAFRNKMFYFMVFIGLILMLHSFVYMYLQHQYTMEVLDMKLLKNKYTNVIFTLFNLWFGADDQSLGSSIFYFIYPILIAVPYGHSLAYDYKVGFKNQLLVLSGRKKYYFIKELVCFLVSGTVYIIPLITSLILCGFFFPAVKPDVIFMTSYGVFPENIFSSIFYTNPLLYDFIFIIISFVIVGFLSLLSFIIIKITDNIYFPIIVPFIFVLFSDYISHKVQSLLHNSQISLFYILRLRDTSSSLVSLWVFPMYICIIIGIVYFCVNMNIKNKNEL